MCAIPFQKITQKKNLEAKKKNFFFFLRFHYYIVARNAVINTYLFAYNPISLEQFPLHGHQTSSSFWDQTKRIWAFPHRRKLFLLRNLHFIHEFMFAHIYAHVSIISKLGRRKVPFCRLTTHIKIKIKNIPSPEQNTMDTKSNSIMPGIYDIVLKMTDKSIYQHFLFPDRFMKVHQFRLSLHKTEKNFLQIPQLVFCLVWNSECGST